MKGEEYRESIWLVVSYWRPQSAPDSYSLQDFMISSEKNAHLVSMLWDAGKTPSYVHGFLLKNEASVLLFNQNAFIPGSHFTLLCEKRLECQGLNVIIRHILPIQPVHDTSSAELAEK